MPYQVDRFNGTFLVSVADGTVDSTTDLRFLGKNYAGYGEVQNENFLHLLENFANTTPPPRAIGGQIWYDSATKRLKYYDQDNNKWRTTGGIEASPTAPLKLNVGDLWYDTSADQLYSWNGNSYVLIGPQPTVGGTLTPVNVDLIKGIDDLNYSIVSLKSGPGDTVAIFSTDNFVPDIPITGFSEIRRGINLFRTNYQTGISEGDYRFWGTATSAESLVVNGIKVNSDQFVTKGESSFTSTVAFVNSGFTVGVPNNNLAVFIESATGTVFESRNSEPITIRIRESSTVVHNLLQLRAPVLGSIGSVSPGSDAFFNLGTPGNRWSNVYATTYNGNLVGNVTGDTVGNHRGNLRADNNDIVFNAATKTFNGTFDGVFFGTLNGNITGSANTASTLNGISGSVPNVGNTLVIRDGSGNINATRFVGTADRADQLKLGSLYVSTATAVTPSTIVVRDANGNINVNTINGTATAANSLRDDSGIYRTASSSAVGNTVVVRDAAGNIAVNGIIGAASQANQLLVDNSTFRLASASAVANTIAVRDGNGAIRAISIQNTPIGSQERSTGAFTTLTANAATTLTANVASTNTTTGTLVVTGGVGISGALFCGSITETSTIAVKENVNPINDALDKILKLTGVTYDRKDSGAREAGLIAEEVAGILPEIVANDVAGNPIGIQYNKLTAYLIEAVKSLKEEIEQLKRS